MSFLHPLILSAGLLAIAIPIIIHFIRRRRRPIEWAAMRFLQDALRKRRRRLRLEQLLLLLTRCAIVALLAIAIARPTAGGDVSSLPTTHIIAIDNSIASASTTDGVSDLDRSIDAALSIIERAARSPGDTVAVITLGAPGTLERWPASPDTDAARRTLDRITPTDSRASLDILRDAISQIVAADTPDASTRTVLHIVSSWRQPEGNGITAELASRAPIAGVDAVELHTPAPDPAQSQAGVNIGIASLSVSTPTVVGSSTLAPQTRVFGTLVRSGDPGATLAEQSIAIELIAQPSGTIAGRATARFEAGQTALDWSAGVNDAALDAGRGGRIALSATLGTEDTNPRDNRANIVLSRKRELRAGVVERPPVGIGTGVTPGTWALAALTPDERAGVASFRVDPASLGSIPAGSVDALFILEPSRVNDSGWARAGELLARGGLIVITPDADTGSGVNATDWAEPLRTLSDNQITINTNAGVRTDPQRLAPTPPTGLLSSLQGEFADLIGSVGVRQRLELIAAPSAVVSVSTEPAAARTPADPNPGVAQAGSPFIAQTSSRGTLVVFAAPLDVAWTDLPARPVFVPIVQELIRRGSGIGVDNHLAAGAAGDTFLPAGAIDRWTFDPSMSGATEPVGPPGAHAGVWLGLDSDGQIIRTLSIRPDARASVLGQTTSAQRTTALASLFPGAAITDDAPAKPGSPSARSATPWGDRLALILLAACAALAVLEALLARVASHPAGAAA